MAKKKAETKVIVLAPEGTEPAVVAKVAAEVVAKSKADKKAPKAKAKVAKSPVGVKADVDSKGRQLWRVGTNCAAIFNAFKTAGKKGITIDGLIAAVEIESKNKPYLVKKLAGEFIARGFSAKKTDEGKLIFIP